MSAQQARNGGGRGQSRELVRLCAIPRGRDGAEELRVTLDEFEPSDGGEAKQYVSARIWYRSTSGEHRPTQKGLTVRRAELRRVIESLIRADRALAGKENQSAALRNSTRGSGRQQAFRQALDAAPPAPPASEAEIAEDSRLF